WRGDGSEYFYRDLVRGWCLAACSVAESVLVFFIAWAAGAEFDGGGVGAISVWRASEVFDVRRTDDLFAGGLGGGDLEWENGGFLAGIGAPGGGGDNRMLNFLGNGHNRAGCRAAL